MPKSWFSVILVRPPNRLIAGLLASLILVLPASDRSVSAVIDEDACAYWEYRHWSCEVDGDKAKVNTRRKLVVRDARGDSHAWDVFAEDKFRKLKEVRITVRSSNGEVLRKLSHDDLEKHCGFGSEYQVYSDICFYEYRPSVPQYPYSVEYEIERELKSAFFLGGTRVATSAPVLVASCSLRCDPDTPLRFKTYGLKAANQVDTVDKDRILVWEFENLNGIDSDTLDAVAASLGGELSVMVDKYKFAGEELREGSWAGLGEWYARVVGDRCDENMDLEDLPDSASAPIDRLRLIYDTTRDQNRYVSVTMGESGWRPRKASDVAKTRYGDCKDLTTLLVSRLRGVGIEAHPCLILTRGEGYLDPEFPSTDFNHVIALALLDNDTIWMDPTCSSCPLGEIPWSDQYTKALIASDSNSQLVPTPESGAPDNLHLRRSELVIGSDRHLSVKAEITLVGQPAISYRSSLATMNRSDVMQMAARMLSGGAARWKVVRAEFSNVEDLYLPLELTIEAESAKPVRVIDGTAYIESCVFDLDPDVTDGDFSERTRPIRLRYPWLEIDSVWLSIDSTLPYDSIVSPVTLSDSCSVSYSQVTSGWEADQLTVQSVVSYFGQVIESMHFERLRNFEGGLASSSRGLVKLYLKR